MNLVYTAEAHRALVSMNPGQAILITETFDTQLRFTPKLSGRCCVVILGGHEVMYTTCIDDLIIATIRPIESEGNGRS